MSLIWIVFSTAAVFVASWSIEVVGAEGGRDGTAAGGGAIPASDSEAEGSTPSSPAISLSVLFSFRLATLSLAMFGGISVTS